MYQYMGLTNFFAA